MSRFRIICKDNVRPARLLRWSSSKSATVASELTQLFQRVAAGTQYQPVASFSQETPDPHELVIHFLGHRSSSVIRRLTGQEAGTAEGATLETPRGMVSEIYVGDISVIPRAIANLAFHELMHNKLDAQNNRRERSVRNIHTHGGGGLATGDPIGDSTPLTGRNITLMRAALSKQVVQFTGS